MRRILVPKVTVGRIDLSPDQAHHFRDVLRLKAGAPVEVFDRAGGRGRGQIVSVSDGVTVEVEHVDPPRSDRFRLTIASAIPKGTRADWMIEKLGELGVETFIPLAAQRSVVLPDGAGKHQRWARIAAESARQSERTGVMNIEPLTKVSMLVEQARNGELIAWYLSPAEDAPSIIELAGAVPAMVTLLIGPEGGWTPQEIESFKGAGIGAIRLTRTILRVETAAVAGAAVIQSVLTLGPAAATIVPNAARKSI